MFKYIWIFMLVILYVFGWIYVIRDFIYTARDFTKIFNHLEDFTEGWIVAHFALLFISSLIFFFQ